MTVELSHPYEQLAEQIMYAKGAPSLSVVLSQAIAAMHGSLTDEEKSVGLARMIQAGDESGSSGESIEEIFAAIEARLTDPDRPQSKPPASWPGRTMIDEDGTRWPDIDDDSNWFPELQGKDSLALAGPPLSEVELTDELVRGLNSGAAKGNIVKELLAQHHAEGKAA